MNRCSWACASELEMHYHDHEWGVPVHDDRILFEFLILEGAQAGLSWSTILKKRDGYRAAFDQFDAEQIAAYNTDKVAALLANPAIIRNRLKINSAITNARAFLEVQAKYGSFDRFIWQFTSGETQQNHWQKAAEVPAHSSVSDAMSKTLKKQGFKFVGTTICYAFMQAVGMANDHTIDCFRHDAVKQLESL
ncbi:DNA-3-methyladenine glycosylase I [Methylicorpusculum sp.]|uniref:DNA-3-methyladenine glycosylase I n=1 Tax=Methylicorpusculum sp. TaxID=2713644 RepID=UPI00272FEF14|nr:DNA-3-methyladenine glycosylase I [Methylicorpusculum sp.]MDP2180935.1 DNA-3-methyladenine glycosylase I [Methylicorpusculum sp.]MDP3528847.1 DNA-3-methyladenine glycosylase I [Methylicorpusculum sp.]